MGPGRAFHLVLSQSTFAVSEGRAREKLVAAGEGPSLIGFSPEEGTGSVGHVERIDSLSGCRYPVIILRTSLSEKAGISVWS